MKVSNTNRQVGQLAFQLAKTKRSSRNAMDIWEKMYETWNWYTWTRWHGKLSWMNTSKFDMNCFQDRPDSPFMNAFMYTSVSLKSTRMIFYNKDFFPQNRKSVQKLFLFHQRKIANLGQALTTSIEGSLLFKLPWDQIVPSSLIAFPAFHDAVKSAPSS